MTDRELLELAAKAAGIKVPTKKDYPWAWIDESGIHRDISSGGDGTRMSHWNPITDDGAALRLFCALPWMCIETSNLAVTVRERGKPDEPSRVYLVWTEGATVAVNTSAAVSSSTTSLAAATRRAIVRAAAEIGRQMK